LYIYSNLRFFIIIPSIFVPMAGNSLSKNVGNKNNISKKSNFSDIFKPEPKNNKNKISNSLIKDARFKQIVGIGLALFTLFLVFSFFSYFSTFKADLDKVHNAGFSILLDKNIQVSNKAGKLGALTAHNLIFGGFGILTLLLIPMIAGWCFNIFSTVCKFTFLPYLKYAAPSILIGSPLLAYFSSNSSFPFGGYYGSLIIQFLNNFAGSIGTGFILFGALIIAIIVLFKPNFKLPQTLLSKNADAIPIPVVEKTTNSKQKGNNLATDNTFQDVFHEEDAPGLFLHSDLEVMQNTLRVPEEEPALDTNMELEKEESIGLAENTNHSQLLDINTPNTEAKKSTLSNTDDLDMEVVVKPAEETVITDTHSSIENAEAYDPSLDLSNYKYPTLDLLEDRGAETISVTKEELEQNKNQIIQTLKNFGIGISKISATVGPTVTLYEIVPADGVRISKIRNLEDDIALSLAALGIRIIAPIPGKGTIGIEVPNLKKQIVNMRSLIASEKFINNNFSLPIALGKRIDNENYIVDLATMPHLLMAGATGQGKSVGLNAILVSLLYKKHPSQLKFVLVDPKKVELSIYKVIERHFLAKLPNEEESIITDTKKVINTLNALCIEMDQRYDLLKEAGVRNIKEYNEKFIKRKLNPNKGHRYLPFIVLVVDEFADLIMTAGKEVEMPIARLAQLARAIGIHLIIATQRPSVNVITGTIKANFPARIAFRVSAKVDSRTILDSGGAEQLVGRGDMLINTGNELTRVQCAFVDTPEVEKIVDFIGEQQGYPSAYELPEYVGPDADFEVNGGKPMGDIDNMFEQAARLVVSSQSGSTSMLQRRFNLGYNRAGRIMDQMEASGIVGPGSGGKPREVLVKTEMELEEYLVRLNP
jgi:DNA segregation ATPase FtsK/SpoIIIE, S-DNA-T family